MGAERPGPDEQGELRMDGWGRWAWMGACVVASTSCGPNLRQIEQNVRADMARSSAADLRPKLEAMQACFANTKAAAVATTPTVIPQAGGLFGVQSLRS